MTVETTLYSAVTGDGTVNGLIGTRCYPVRAPGRATRPYITYFVISRTIIGGTCYRARIQLTITDTSYSGVKSVRDALQTLTEGTANWVWLEGPDAYEDQEGLFHQSVDLQIF